MPAHKLFKEKKMTKSKLTLNVIIIKLCCFFLIAACSNDEFEGEYISKAGETTSEKLAENFLGRQKLSFRVDGKVTIYMGDRKLGVLKYEKNGDEITVFKADNAAQIYTLEDDGSLFGGGFEFVKVNKIIIEQDSVAQPSDKIILGNYISKPDPAFNPEYATVTKLFFEPDNKVKLSMKFYDTGEFRENELILNYKINGDKITSVAENGTTLILTIRADGSLFDGVKTEFFRLDE
jgi:hypothetical protein